VSLFGFPFLRYFLILRFFGFALSSQVVNPRQRSLQKSFFVPRYGPDMLFLISELNLLSLKIPFNQNGKTFFSSQPACHVSFFPTTLPRPVLYWCPVFFITQAVSYGGLASPSFFLKDELQSTQTVFSFLLITSYNMMSIPITHASLCRIQLLRFFSSRRSHFSQSVRLERRRRSLYFLSSKCLLIARPVLSSSLIFVGGCLGWVFLFGGVCFFFLFVLGLGVWWWVSTFSSGTCFSIATHVTDQDSPVGELFFWFPSGLLLCRFSFLLMMHPTSTPLLYPFKK